MSSILVTGSNGFIGKKIIERFPESEVLGDNSGLNRIDLTNIEQLLKIDPVQTVIHLAGKTPKNDYSWRDYFDNNVKSTMNILEYCILKKVKKLIFVSSYVYGKPKYNPIDEKHPIVPHNAYAESKILGEKLCEFYSKNSELNVIILRPFNIYGSSMNQGFFLSNLIKSIKNNEKMSIINKNSKRDFLHINDFVEMISKIISYESKFEIFNVGTGESFSFNEIIKMVENWIPKKIEIEYSEDKEIFIEDIRSDISKIQDAINWKPKIKLDDGLKEILKI